jgi:DNA-binding GntR family transcriptional regulator
MQSHGKSSRVNDAYVQIKAEILSNRLPPGFQAPEPEVALRLGMSRTPVREALIRLEADGLVELIPRRGVRVLPLRAEDMAKSTKF